MKILFFLFVLSTSLFAEDMQVKKGQTQEPSWSDERMQMIRKFFDEDSFDGLAEHFRKVEKEMNEMMKSMQGSFFGEQGLMPDMDRDGLIKITKKETTKYTIYEIDTKKIDKESLKIDIKDGLLTIKAQSKGKNTFMSDSKSFSLPEGVQASKVEISPKKGEDVIIVKVPKDGGFPGKSHKVI